ncbi:MAG TPA: hypothetical protein VGT44_14720, partial [Ktedonobacteraceae bacterium]|nr:hypothetical protein [Ktedonobacteraceae bacterium]
GQGCGPFSGDPPSSGGPRRATMKVAPTNGDEFFVRLMPIPGYLTAPWWGRLEKDYESLAIFAVTRGPGSRHH